MRFAPLVTLALLAPWLLAGCGDKAAVTLSVNLESPTLAVSNAGLGDTLSGSFNLRLELGKEAPGARSISLGGFSVQGTGGTSVDSLPVDAGSTTFPLTLSPGDDRSIPLTFQLSRVLTQPEHDALCPGPAQILGSVLEDGKAHGVSSSPVSPSCN